MIAHEVESQCLCPGTHVFSTWMPAAVRPSANRRPLPTMPKLAADATATRLS